MHYLKLTAPVLLSLALGTVALAGPPLVCHAWVSTPGSVFEALEPLRSIALEADDSPANKEKALAKLAALRAAVKPGDAMSLLKAGYWATAMHLIGVSPATDGPELIRQAVELRSDDAEYHVIAAMAYLSSDKAAYQKHWQRAKALAKPGSAAARNLPGPGLERMAGVH
jgi:hypothetical protein